ncbi:CsbD family protein [Pseudonocardia sp. EV170527-09]|uniref:CsbD family protein n=1 Tax=Pseudonocardia sp. EV170527-09 TaxID=2603411 RepID=UPI0011F15BBC|nr:CsbD family protein [Pseudonocardia sp. EV170527-09]KAA1012824.1 CsbD family protein [Pseudonocardia sp. EV170527-09]
MSFIDKAKNKAQDAVGKAKEKVGDVTNNDDLKRDGQAAQAEAAAKNVKDTFTKD